MQKTDFSLSALALSILTAALAGAGSSGSVRGALLYGAVDSAALTVLVLLAGTFWQAEGRTQRVGAAVLSVALLFELAQTLLQAQRVAQQEFHSMALIGLLPLLLWAGWSIHPTSWNAPARVLWWFVVLGAAIYLLGLLGQMDWTRLVAADAAQPVQRPGSFFYAEYLLWPLLCPQTSGQKAAALPWIAYAVQAGTAAGLALVFGASGYPAAELLRAWSTGVFSRMDALLLLVWLACAIYRICVLCAGFRLCLQKAAGAERSVPQ